MTDILERLRASCDVREAALLRNLAANEIATLRLSRNSWKLSRNSWKREAEFLEAENERLRELLRWIRANTDASALDEIDARIVAALKEDKPLQPMETCPECRVYSEGGRAHRQVPPCSRLAASAPAKEQP